MPSCDSLRLEFNDCVYIDHGLVQLFFALKIARCEFASREFPDSTGL